MRWTESGKKKDVWKSYKIPGGLSVGKQVTLRGRASTEAFSINFSESENFLDGNALFHFVPRPSDGDVARNSHIDGSWGSEEKDQPHFPFDAGKSFTVRIDVREDRYVIYVNGKHFVDFRHRMDLNRGRYLILSAEAEYYDVVFHERRIAPYQSPVPNGMTVGKTFRIRGMCTDENGFSINFKDNAGNYYFHFNPRPRDQVVVRNAHLGSWGGEEKEGPGFPFNPWQLFDASFVCLEDRFSVFVNDEHFTDFAHRADLACICVLSLEGSITYQDVDCSETKGEQMVKEVDSGLECGDIYEFHGKMKPSAERFAIDFINGSDGGDDIAFHFNARRSEGQVVMNSRLGGAWQGEERTDLHAVFDTEKPFEVRIVTKKKKFKVFVNGEKFCKFRMRSDVEDIRAIQVNGDVFIQDTFLMKKMEQPIREQVPFELEAGSWVIIRGIPKKRWSRFNIDFMCENGDVAFHFNPRKDQSEVVRNSRLGDSWGEEEKEAPDFPFEARDTFDVVFYVGEDKFVTFLNGKSFIEYQHRTPISTISHLCIGGDCLFYEPEFQ